MSTTRFSLDVDAFCALPLVRRLYKTLVVALAVFLLTMVAFKQPFRGYLAEAKLSGPAMEGLDLDEAVAWVKQLDSQVAAVANGPNLRIRKSQIRITHVAGRTQTAVERVDGLAERWLYQYLPDRLQGYRQTVLADLRRQANAARHEEDAAREQLEMLRQSQLAQIRRAAEEARSQGTGARGQRPKDEAGSLAEGGTDAVSELARERIAEGERLAKLRLELGRLTSHRTEEHPEIKTLRSQVAAAEQQLGILPGQALPLAPPSGTSTRGAQHFVSSKPATQQENAAGPASSGTPDQRLAESVAAEVSAVLSQLSCASSTRQEAEGRLSDRMHQLSSQGTASQWSKAAVTTIARLGGTPRFSTLVLAGFFACAAGTVVFRAAGAEVCSPAIRSTAELASVLELPVVGNLAHLRPAAARMPWRLLSAGRVRILVLLADIVVATAVGACLLSMAVEPGLVRQVIADPFGTLSEVMGRFGV